MKDKIIKIISILPAICIFFCVSAPELSAASETENSSARVHSKIERNVGNFTGLVSSGSIAVTYIQSDITKVVIEGDPQFFDFLETKVSLGQLYIRITKSSYRSLNLSVTVYSPTLDSIASSGSGTVYDVEGHVSSGNIRF